jgi:DnaD/phage-associated family protein
MGAKFWIKLYHEILDDPKMGRMPDRLWRRTIELFLLAGELDQEGLLPSVHDMSWRLRVNDDALQDDLNLLISYGIVTVDNDVFTVTKFAERQTAMTATERAARDRAAKKNAVYYGESEPTRELSVRKAYADCNETRKLSVTKANTDIDIDKSREEGDTDTEPLPPAGAIFKVYESEIGVLTATIADELKLAVSEYPDGWIIDALKESARQNKRNWSYARAILKRWKAEGRGNGHKVQSGADLDKFRALYQQQKKAGG